MSADRISVIVPTRRRPHLLPRAVASVFAQTHANFELLVVDDNDPADRAATAAALAPWRGDARLRSLVNPHRRNCSAARNCGLRAATGEWVTFLDDDDAYRPAKLARQLALARERNAPLVLCGLCYHAAARLRLRQCDRSRFAGDDLLLRAQASAPALFFRREDDVFFDEEFDAVEDGDIFLRLVARWRLTEVDNVPEPLVDVFQQTVRLNTQATPVLRGQRRLWFRHAQRRSTAARLLAARLWLAREAWGSGWGRPLAAARQVVRLGGLRETRLVLNFALRRVPGVRRWLSV
jgi:glycosyltransferase involved in cell wall biosynthesis